jgi:hypothetical protein
VGVSSATGVTIWSSEFSVDFPDKWAPISNCFQAGKYLWFSLLSRLPLKDREYSGEIGKPVHLIQCIDATSGEQVGVNVLQVKKERRPGLGRATADHLLLYNGNTIECYQHSMDLP